MSEPVKLVVMGVAGCGKSTLALGLAEALAALCLEGDDFHPPASVEKMRRGIALQDSDREPWLARIGAALREHPGAVVASCSALRQHYRDLLRRSTPALKFVYLRITQSQALERVRERSGHYMPPELVRSQFDALEPPTDEDGVIAVEAEWPTPLQVRTVLAWLEAPDAIPPPHTHR